MIKLGQSPIDEPQLSRLVVDHHIMRLHVTVHDAARMTVIQRLQNLINIISNIEVGKRRVQCLEVGVVDVLKDQRRDS